MLSNLDKPRPQQLASPVSTPSHAPSPPDFTQLYEDHFAFVWRCARRLGVPDAQVDDAVQDVFLVVHRQLADYTPDHAPKAWLFSITRRVASDHRRRIRRKGGLSELSPETPAHERDGPQAQAERNQASNIVQRFLQQLDEAHASVFILSELEQMTAPEVAQTLSIEATTVYTRVRSTRNGLRKFVAEHHGDYLEQLDD